MTEAEVVKMLLEHGQQRYESHRYRLPKHVADLVYTNAFAFLVAVAFDRGMSWKKAWEISYWISEEGKLDTDLLAQMSYTALASLLESLPFLPRYGSTEGARTLRDCAKLALEFGGDAASIWRDASPKQVENRLRRIHGVGQGIASMAVRVLRDDHLMFRGQEHEINVKLGVHVMRVFITHKIDRFRKQRGGF